MYVGLLRFADTTGSWLGVLFEPSVQETQSVLPRFPNFRETADLQSSK